MRLDGVLLMLLAGSLALNVWLGLARQAGPDAATQPPSSLPAGTRLPPLSGRTLDGRRFRIDPGATRTETAVYVFSARCSWCERDLNNIRTLAGRRGDRIRFLAVSTGPEDLRSLRDYARAVAFNLEVVSDVPADQRTAYGLDGTPQLLVLGNDGRLRKAFKGALQGRSLEEAEAFFGLDLPGTGAPPRLPGDARRVGPECVDLWGAAFDQGARWPVHGVAHVCSTVGWTPEAEAEE
jgi:hypothetical protein